MAACGVGQGKGSRDLQQGAGSLAEAAQLVPGDGFGMDQAVAPKALSVLSDGLLQVGQVSQQRLAALLHQPAARGCKDGLLGGLREKRAKLRRRAGQEAAQAGDLVGLQHGVRQPLAQPDTVRPLVQDLES